MPTPGSHPRFARLAFWLSLLALCSALWAPVSVLAQEMRTGQWTGLCSATGASHAQADGDEGAGHCGLCAWPGLASVLPSAPALPAPAAPVQDRATDSAPQVPAPWNRPAIRGPPFMS